jgi:hypothetical protein
MAALCLIIFYVVKFININLFLEALKKREKKHRHLKSGRIFGNIMMFILQVFLNPILFTS